MGCKSCAHLPGQVDAAAREQSERVRSHARGRAHGLRRRGRQARHHVHAHSWHARVAHVLPAAHAAYVGCRSCAADMESWLQLRMILLQIVLLMGKRHIITTCRTAARMPT